MSIIKPQMDQAIILISFTCLLILTIVPSRLSATSQNDQHYYFGSSNYLLFSADSAAIDDRLGELLKDQNHNHVSDRVNISLANSIWRKMHSNALEYARQRAELVRPSANQLFDRAEVSATCRKSLNDMIDHVAKLDRWAVQMYNAFGDFPAQGFIEGSLNSMGSYKQCVDVVPNEFIGEPRYCSFQYQPILPKRPRYHNILSSIEQLANFTSEDDLFNYIGKKAQYFYYTKLRLATCLPSKCENSDLDKMAKQVSLNTYLQFSGVTCLSKSEGFKPDGAQIFAIVFLLSFASVSLIGTLVHLFNVKSFLVNQKRSNFRSYTALDTHKNNADNLIKNGQSVGRKGSHFSIKHHQQQMALLGPKSDQINVDQKPDTANPELDSSNVADGTNCKPALGSARTQPWVSENTRLQLLRVVNILNNFSIIKNGAKLFDTSSSKPRGNVNIVVKGRSDGKQLNKPIIVELERSSSSVTGSEAGGSSSSQSDSSLNNSDSPTNDISCVHGLRFWTISWIIFAHTMQYTEWSGFGRTFEVENNIVSFWLHPLLNATFSVDTFFLISGLLTTYVTWSITGGDYQRFNKFAFLISRYLRLTPQVLIVILLFIIFPLAGDGPYWSGLIQKQSDNCKQNWWVSALYLQSFIRQDRICNLVTWWLSIEMYFHFMSIIIIISLLKNARTGFMSAFGVGFVMFAISCYKHYANHYPPNLLPTLLQRYEVWDSLILEYFWSPYPHASAYVVGLMLGYILSTKDRIKLNKTLVRWGWFAFSVSYVSILCGTYWWNNNSSYSRALSTFYYNTSQLFWALSTGWAILACATGNGGWVNSFLSAQIFIPLGRATYMTYLSHMLIVLSYPAKMNLLIEPTHTVFLYIFIANLFLSYFLGIFLTLVYESPILHLQKLLVNSMAQKCLIDEKKGSSIKIAEVA